MICLIRLNQLTVTSWPRHDDRKRFDPLLRSCSFCYWWILACRWLRRQSYVDVDQTLTTARRITDDCDARCALIAGAHVRLERRRRQQSVRPWRDVLNCCCWCCYCSAVPLLMPMSAGADAVGRINGIDGGSNMSRHPSTNSNSTDGCALSDVFCQFPCLVRLI